jgi:ADP-ribosylglycohydrolase
MLWGLLRNLGHGLKPGEWTDDTAMALSMAASLLERVAAVEGLVNSA